MSVRIHFLKDKQRLSTGVGYNLLVSEVKTFMQSFLATNEECVLTDGQKRLDDQTMIGSIQGDEPLYCITKQQYITFLEEMVASQRMLIGSRNGVLSVAEQTTQQLVEHIRNLHQDRDPRIRQQEKNFYQGNYQMLGGGEPCYDDLSTITLVQERQLEQLKALHNKLNHLLDFNHDSVMLDLRQELKTQTELVQNLLYNNQELVQESDQRDQIISELKEKISKLSQTESELIYFQQQSAQTIDYLQGRIEVLQQQIYTARLVKEVEQTDYWKEDLAERIVSFFKELVPTMVQAKETLAALEKQPGASELKPGQLEELLKQEKLKTKWLEEENGDLRKIVKTLRNSLVRLKLFMNFRELPHQEVYVGNQINYTRLVEYRPPEIATSDYRICREDQQIYESPVIMQERRGPINLSHDMVSQHYMRPLINYKRI